jgi:uncharacterized membrane protein
MKEYTIRIPENKAEFFLELLRQLGIRDVAEKEIPVTEAQKELILNRIANSKSGDLEKWDDVKDTFVFD